MTEPTITCPNCKAEITLTARLKNCSLRELWETNTLGAAP